MRLVVVESPYAAPTPEGIERNVRYARAAMRDCLLRGEAPYASHLLYTQEGVLRDEVPDERRLGMDAGFEWRQVAAATVVYVDLGTSRGMTEGVKDAEKRGNPVEYRSLGGEWTEAGRKAIEVRASGVPLDVALDDLVLAEGSSPIQVIQVVMEAYGLGLAEAKGRVTTRCHELQQLGRKA